jgi:hypothetical protein
MDVADSSRMTLEAPSELVGPLPRAVTLNDGDGRYALIVVLLFFVGGSIWLGWMGYDDFQQFKDRALLRSDGRIVLGEVTGFSSSRSGPTRVDYTFTFGGVTHAGEAAEAASWGPGLSLHKADQIFVRFLPSDPAINHPDAWEWSMAIGWSTIAFQIFYWLLGAFSLFYLCRCRTLPRLGNVAAGIVTSCVRKDDSFHIEYEFRTADGASMNGNSDRKEEYETGATVWVLYLPQRPRRNDLYPVPLFDIAG